MNISITEASTVPVYIQISEQIKKYIERENIAEGTALPALKTIANQAGVSLKTADRAVDELIVKGICFRRPKKGTYVGRRSQKTRGQQVYGLYHSGGFNSLQGCLWHSSIYSGITEGSAESGKHLIFMTGDIYDSIDTYRGSPEIQMNGVIMLLWEGLEAGVDLANRIPEVNFVFLHYYIKGFEETPDNVYGIYSDDFAGAYQLGEYLFAQGHRRIAVFNIDTYDENNRNKIVGLRQALTDNGRKFSDDLIFSRDISIGNQFLAGQQMAEECISSGAEVDAIFCVDDEVAESALQVFRAYGLNNVEITGYNCPLSRQSTQKAFTTVALDFAGMGKRAVELLDGRRRLPKVTRLTPQLIVKNQSISLSSKI